MDRRKDTVVEAVLEQVIVHGPEAIALVFARAFELAMQIERERFLVAGLYDRTPDRRGYANGYKLKRIDKPAGTVSVQVPKTAGHDGDPFHPPSRDGDARVRHRKPVVLAGQPRRQARYIVPIGCINCDRPCRA